MDPLPWDQLFAAADAAREKAYAPYSRFKVGAAALFEDGSIHAGCNTENSSYGLTICAERAAICRAVVEGKRKLLAMAVVADSEQACPPCGSCRQMMAEFGTADAVVSSRTVDGQKMETFRLDELLPHAFTKDYL